MGILAEPATEDRLKRCIQPARDGWSVVRLIERTPTGESSADRIPSLAAQLRPLGAPRDLKVFKFAKSASNAERKLDEIDALIGAITVGEPQAIAFEAIGGTDVPALTAVMSNGFAG
jgi:hypothetical protein